MMTTAKTRNLLLENEAVEVGGCNRRSAFAFDVLTLAPFSL